MVKRAERIAELQAMIESAKAEIKQIRADEQAEKAETETGKAMNFKAAASSDRGLTGNRDADGNFVPENVDGAPMNFKEAAGGGLEVPITVSQEEMNEKIIDKDMRTDEESARRRFTGVDPVETIPSSMGGDLEMGGGRAKSEEVEESKKTDGFKADKGGNMSVDEKDDFWKTQEGYNKAMEMYGQKPAFVPDEPTMIWNPEEQKYEKIKEEDKEEFEDLGIPADIKSLFG